jgi:hypothetical protein
LEGLKTENVVFFYGLLEYLTSISCILWPFGTFCGDFVKFSRFGKLYEEKSGNPAEKN